MKCQKTLFVLLFWSSFCIAQDNYLPGYYIDTNGETIRGFINDKEWEVNPDKIRFKKDDTGKPLIITPETVKGFGIENGDRYVARTVDVNIAPIKLNELGKTKEPIFERGTFFLRVLVDGNASLFFLHDKIGKKHFFIEKADLPVEELIFTRYLKWVKGKGNVMPFYQYKGQLTNSFSDCEAISGSITQVKYESKDFVEIFENYNKCNGGKITYVYKEKKPGVQFGGIVEGGISMLSFDGNSSDVLLDMEFDITPAYSLGMFVQFNSARLRESVALKGELYYTTFSAKSSYEETIAQVEKYKEVDFRWGYLQFNTLLQYTVPLKSDIKPYINGGIGWASLAIEGNREYTETTFFSTTTTTTEKVFDSRTFELPRLVSIGITSKKFSVGFRYSIGRRISPFTSFYAKHKMVLLTGQYHF